jgi:phospholipid/cholesterol/gamma-HCH transport system substrate-binding protein
MIVSGIREGKGTIGKLITDDAMYTSAKNIVADAEKAVASLREASDQPKDAIADLRGENGPLKGVTGTLEETLSSARDAMQDLADNTEALKRNFLFRGYFNKRGFFDLDEISVQQYREGALEGHDRHALRIWISAPVLFEIDANGQRLSEGGQARLDSTMSQFVRYQKTARSWSKGMRDVTNDRRFLISREQAKLVRDYVVGKFGPIRRSWGRCRWAGSVR